MGSAASIYVTGPERLKAYVWDKFQQHKTRMPVSEARATKAQSNYIEVYTKNVRKKINPLSVKNQSHSETKKVSKKPQKQPKSPKVKQKRQARK